MVSQASSIKSRQTKSRQTKLCVNERFVVLFTCVFKSMRNWLHRLSFWFFFHGVLQKQAAMFFPVVDEFIESICEKVHVMKICVL